MTEAKKICGAKRQNRDAVCQSTVIMPNGRCRLHGGATPSGIASPQYKHGRYMRWERSLPARMRARLREAAEDPNILELIPDIAVIDARLDELHQRVEQGEAGYVWDKLTAAHAAYSQAMAKVDIGAAQIHLMEMCRLIARGAQDVQAWREIHSLYEQRRRFVESERKRLVETEQVIFMHEALEHYKRMGAIVKTYVTDETIKTLTAQDILANIHRDFEAAITGGGVRAGDNRTEH